MIFRVRWHPSSRRRETHARRNASPTRRVFKFCVAAFAYTKKKKEDFFAYTSYRLAPFPGITHPPRRRSPASASAQRECSERGRLTRRMSTTPRTQPNGESEAQAIVLDDEPPEERPAPPPQQRSSPARKRQRRQPEAPLSITPQIAAAVQEQPAAASAGTGRAVDQLKAMFPDYDTEVLSSILATTPEGNVEVAVQQLLEMGEHLEREHEVKADAELAKKENEYMEISSSDDEPVAATSAPAAPTSAAEPSTHATADAEAEAEAERWLRMHACSASTPTASSSAAENTPATTLTAPSAATATATTTALSAPAAAAAAAAAAAFSSSTPGTSCSASTLASSGALAPARAGSAPPATSRDAPTPPVVSRWVSAPADIARGLSKRRNQQVTDDLVAAVMRLRRVRIRVGSRGWGWGWG